MDMGGRNGMEEDFVGESCDECNAVVMVVMGSCNGRVVEEEATALLVDDFVLSEELLS